MTDALLHIRPYQDSDEKDIIDIWRECNLLVPWNNPKLDIKRKLKVNPELFLVGLLDGKIVATVMGGYEGRRGWMNYLAVSPDHQRNGFSRQIVSVLENKLRAMGCPKINLQVRTGNIGVIKFYESLGYSDDHVFSMGKRLIDDPEYNI
jgi:ribosomal protein S18 acetylase RimI-like enzyme